MTRNDHGVRVLALLVGAVALVAMTAIGITAQSGKPVPRLSNGKPDFTGVWDHPRVGDITSAVKGTCASGGRGCSSVVSGELSFTPAGKAEWDKNNKPTTYDYGAHCQPWGFVRAYNTPYPHAYVHHPDSLAILWEQDNRFHLVPTDGRELPKDLEPTWMGTSVGRWDGDTLVIQTAGFNGRTWLDTAQHPHSDALKLTIRMARPDVRSHDMGHHDRGSEVLHKANQELADLRADGKGRAVRVFVLREQPLPGWQMRGGRRPEEREVVGFGSTGVGISYQISTSYPSGSLKNT